MGKLIIKATPPQEKWCYKCTKWHLPTLACAIEEKKPLALPPPKMTRSEEDAEIARHFGLDEEDTPQYVRDMLANMFSGQGRLTPPNRETPLSNFLVKRLNPGAVDPASTAGVQEEKGKLTILCKHCLAGDCAMHGYKDGKRYELIREEVPGGVTQDPSNPSPDHGPVGQRTIHNPDGYL